MADGQLAKEEKKKQYIDNHLKYLSFTGFTNKITTIGRFVIFYFYTTYECYSSVTSKKWIDATE